jgi:hypothetical protein
MNRIPVALFRNRADAEPVEQRLRRAGFNTQVVECPPLTRLWFVGHPCGGTRVEVPPNEFEPAEQMLLDWDAAEGSVGPAIRCPECRSFRIEYPQYARHSLLTNLAMGLLAEFHIIERDYYCEDCHYAWPKEGTRARRDRPNLAPYYFIEGVEQTSLAAHVPVPERKAA